MGTKELLNFLSGLVDRLTDEDISFILANQEEAVGLMARALQNRPAAVFKVVGQPVEVPATTEKFVVADHFKVGTDGDVPFSYVGDFFRECFGTMVENPAPASTLIVRELQKPQDDDENVAALGGRDKAAITLREFYEYLKTADRTKWHLAYVNGALRCVRALCHGRRWYVAAYSVVDPHRWNEGTYLVSRNSKI